MQHKQHKQHKHPNHDKRDKHGRHDKHGRQRTECYTLGVHDADPPEKWPQRAVTLLDEGRVDEAGALSERAIEALTANCGADWHERDAATLLRIMRNPERGRALARALWIASTVDELTGRREPAARRCYRAMELYARLRLESEELDVRAARELGSARARLATPPR